MRHLLFAAAMTAATMFAGTAQAGFMGSTVSGTITGYRVVATPFASPQTVSDAVEFQSEFTDDFRQQWTFSVDLTDTAFVLAFDSPKDRANLWSGSGLFRITISGLPALPSDLTLTHLECSTYQCQETPYRSITDLSFADGTFTIGFRGFWEGDRYVFSLPAQDVPEPGALGLLGIGLVGAGLARRRNSRVD